MPTTGRRRLFRRGEDGLEDDDAADLSEDEHAWWAAREGVAGVPRGTNAPPPESGADDRSQFSDYWTADSLFEEPPAAAREPGTDMDDELVADLAMDLDAAHLVLQVEVGASWEEITRAQRRLAKLYHPDRLTTWSPDAQELGRDRMAEINAAHATLRRLHFHQP